MRTFTLNGIKYWVEQDGTSENRFTTTVIDKDGNNILTIISSKLPLLPKIKHKTAMMLKYAKERAEVESYANRTKRSTAQFNAFLVRHGHA